MYVSLTPSCSIIFSMLCRSKRSSTSPRSCSLKLPAFPNHRARLMQKYPKTESYNSFQLISWKEGEEDNQSAGRGRQRSKSYQQVSRDFKYWRSNGWQKDSEDVITLVNTETVHNTRSIKTQCHSTGEGDHIAAPCNLFFNLKKTLSSKRRLLGREVMIIPDGCGLKRCNLYFSRSDVLTLVQEEMQWAEPRGFT